MEAETKRVFDELFNVNVNGHTEEKKGGEGKTLTYLSWCYAWAEVKKRYPDAQYEIEKFNGIPYVFDPNTGYMVYTKVTIEGVTHEMWLPVMDSNNKAMKAEPYQIQTKYKTIQVNAATMFEVNKAIMRCLVKNLAMFGLGLYIYAGEDLPEGEAEDAKIAVELELETAKNSVKNATSSAEVKRLWEQDFAHLQGNADFKALVIKCGTELKNKESNQ
ncbi:MAG: DUF1071 domain-containing protein [Bacteroidales bacterium]|nr:DUF1071 domain-containing protein [Bacteroidales bacterium]MBO7617408.1 DUF1071 domain-containing protein [Bacteroidales bacterium]